MGRTFNEPTCGSGADQTKETNMSELLDQRTKEWVRNIEERKIIRENNFRPSYWKEFEILISTRKLEMSVKKCSGFTRKIKSFTKPHFDTLMKDLKNLNLSKYLSEIAQNIVEVHVNQDELQYLIKLCTELHQRYACFSEHLLESLTKQFSDQQNDLVLQKFLDGMFLIASTLADGILQTRGGFALLLNILDKIVNLDSEISQSLPSLLWLCRDFGYDLAGIIPREVQEQLRRAEVPVPSLSSFIEENAMHSFKRALERYFTKLCKALRKYHSSLVTLVKLSRNEIKRHGEVSVERARNFKEIQSKFQNLMQMALELSEVMNEDLPKFSPVSKDLAMDYEDSGSDKLKVSGISLFGDEETRSFYEDIPNLKEYLPPILYRDELIEAQKEVCEEENESEAGSLHDEEIRSDQLNLECEDNNNSETSEDPEPEPEYERGHRNRENLFSEFLRKLDKVVEAESVDNAAIEFVETFNTKSKRKFLIRTLAAVSKKRADIIRPWARLIAVLSTVFPQVGLEVAELVQKEFRRLVRSKSQFQLDMKIRLSRFIGELVKFKLIPKAKVFVLLRILLADFINHQIAMACTIIESCGGFLRKSSSESEATLKEFVEHMRYKKNAKMMDPSYITMIENAIYMVWPIEAKKKDKKKKPVKHMYITQLLRNLEISNFDQTLCKLRKLDWTDMKLTMYIAKKLTKLDDESKSRMKLVASIVEQLNEYYPNISTHVLDNLINDIEMGMACPRTEFRQRRVSVMKYLGQLFRTKIVKSELIFQILELLISGKYISCDKWTTHADCDKAFRVKLACILVRKCGVYFSQNKQSELKGYLKRLHGYFNSINCHPEIRSKFCDSYSAGSLLEETLENFLDDYKELKERETTASMHEQYGESKHDTHKMGTSAYQTLVYPYSQGVNNFTTNAMHQRRMLEMQQRANPYSLSCQSIPEGTELDIDPMQGDELLEIPEHEDEEFLLELDRLRNETFVPHKRTNTDIPIPLQVPSFLANSNGNGHSDDGKVKFALLTKNKNKDVLKSVAIGVEEDFIQKRRKQEEAERREREEMKQLTLRIREMQVKEEEETNKQELLGTVSSLFTISSFRQQNKLNKPCLGRKHKK